MKKLLIQITKFGIVGTIAFLIDWGLFNIVLILGTIFGGEKFASQELFTLFATSAGFIISLVFNYLASMKFVFKHKKEMNRLKEFLIFSVLSLIGLMINNFVVWLVVYGFPWAHTVPQLLKDNIGKISATAIVMIWNFVTRKIFLDDYKKSNSI